MKKKRRNLGNQGPHLYIMHKYYLLVYNSKTRWDPCWYFGCLTSIIEDYATRWGRFQKIQQHKCAQTCTDSVYQQQQMVVDS